MLSPKFTWIPLGTGGGLLESDLSAHLIAPMGSHDFICLDAGMGHPCIQSVGFNGRSQTPQGGTERINRDHHAHQTESVVGKEPAADH